MIRKAVMADSEAIYALSKELGYEETAPEVALERLQWIIESGIDELYVFEEGPMKGWIHFFIAHRVASPPFLEIGGLVVSSDYRRKGIGKALVDFATSRARDGNLKTRVRCNAKRLSAHEFYGALGFSRSKEQYVFEAKGN